MQPSRRALGAYGGDGEPVDDAGAAWYQAALAKPARMFEMASIEREADLMIWRLQHELLPAQAQVLTKGLRAGAGALR